MATKRAESGLRSDRAARSVRTISRHRNGVSHLLISQQQAYSANSCSWPASFNDICCLKFHSKTVFSLNFYHGMRVGGGTDSRSHSETGFPRTAVGRRSDSVAGEMFCLTPATFSITAIVLSLGQARMFVLSLVSRTLGYAAHFVWRAWFCLRHRFASIVPSKFCFSWNFILLLVLFKDLQNSNA